MGAKDGPLHVSRRKHPEVVQSKLSNRHYFRALRHLVQSLAHLVAISRGIMWVYPHARKYHPGMRLRQCQRIPTRSQVNSRIDHASNAACNSGRNNSFAIGIKT
jgi:hypothetical protein